MPFNISASPLSCQCGQVTITANEIPSPRSSWGVFLFYVATFGETQNYSKSIQGRYGNPSTDSVYDVTLPMNANYTFYGLAISEYIDSVTYSLGDWVYNTEDKQIYVSKAGSNTGQSLSNLIWWRPFDCSDISKVPTHINSDGDYYATSSLTQNVTCNTSFLGLVPKMKYSCETSVQTLAINDRTGLFDFECNPNGYGGLNPSRGDYAQMQILTNTRSNGVMTEYYARAYSYRSALVYNFDIPRDGLYVLNTFFVQLYDSEATYNANDAVFGETSNVFYKSLYDNNTAPLEDGSSWEVIQVLEQFLASNYYKLTQSQFIQDANGRKLLYDLRQGIKNSCPCNCSDKCGDDLMKKWLFVTMCIENACFAMDLFRYEEAQCFLEKIPKNCAPYISIYKC